MRKQSFYYLIGVIFLVFLVLTLGSCAGANQLRTELAQDSEITGSYTLILYGTKNAYELKTVAFLDKEEDGYELVPYAPQYDYKVIKNLPAAEALKKALDYVKWPRDYRSTQLRKILDEQGNVIGYEVRPLYDPLAYGISNVLLVRYWVQAGGKIKVTINLHPTAKEYLRRTLTETGVK
jgi:hypothetical protein